MTSADDRRPAKGTGSRAPTVYDVAEAAGVSIATVSRVLRRPDDVRPATRERVVAAVQELGYVPSAAARGLAGARTGVLGLLLPSFDAPDHEWEGEPSAGALADGDGVIPVLDDRPAPATGATGQLPLPGGPADPAAERASSASLYFDEVVRGAEAEAWRRGFALLVAAGRESGRESLVDDLAGRVDGMMVVASVVPEPLLGRLSARLPTVVVADSAAAPELDRVVVANEAGMHTLVARLLADHPARGIVYVSGPPDSSDEHERRAGFDRAVAECGRDLHVRVEEGDFTERRGAEVGRLLVARQQGRSPLPDAVVCANDQTALGVLTAFARHGVDVPGRVLVTGFDGVDAGRFSRPRLTTVRQPMLQLGRLAVEALAARIADREAPPRRWTLPVEVLLRESCPPVE